MINYLFKKTCKIDTIVLFLHFDYKENDEILNYFSLIGFSSKSTQVSSPLNMAKYMSTSKFASVATDASMPERSNSSGDKPKAFPKYVATVGHVSSTLETLVDKGRLNDAEAWPAVQAAGVFFAPENSGALLLHSLLITAAMSSALEGSCVA